MGLISINNNLPLINKFNLTGRGQNPDDIILIQKSTHVESLQKYALELKSQNWVSSTSSTTIQIFEKNSASDRLRVAAL